MRKIIILLTISLFVFSCQKQEGVTYEEVIGTFVPDSIYTTSVSNLPDGVKRKIDSLSGVKNLQVMDLLENEVAIISSEKGVLTYSIAFKKYEDYKRVLGEPILAKMEKDCDVEYALAGGHHSSLAVNVSGENVGNIVIGAFQNQGTHIISHIYESSGSISHGSHTMDSDSFRGIGRFFGNIFEGVWIGIRWIEDKTRALLKRRFCGCKGRYSRLYVGEEEDAQARVTEPIQEKCCEDDESGENLEHWIDVEHNFYLPKSFLEAHQPPFKTSEEDCRCMLQNELKNTVSIAAFTNTKIDCACKTKNTSVFYKLLQANNVRIKESITEECRFLEENRYSEEAKEFVREALIAIHQGGAVDYLNRLILDWSFVKEERLRCVAYKFHITKNNEISQNLKKFLKDGPKGYLRLSADSNFKTNWRNNTGAMAITRPPNNNIIQIVFNTDIDLPSSVNNNSTLSVGLALIHEILHAEMFKKLLEASDTSFIPEKNTPEWEKLFDKLYGSFYEYFDLYTHISFQTNNPTDVQHQLMAQSYIETLSTALAEFDKNQHSEQFYKEMAWMGLEKTTAHTRLPHSIQLQISETIKKGRNETKDCHN